MKRAACDGTWDSPVPERVTTMLAETLQRVKDSDPVAGVWGVPSTQEGRVWCDASSLATGACLEVSGHIAEDATWLRKPDDGAHINVAELEAVLKGISMGVRWG